MKQSVSLVQSHRSEKIEDFNESLRYYCGEHDAIIDDPKENLIEHDHDYRECEFCGLTGDDEQCERLIPLNTSLSGAPLPFTVYVHINCALWSSEVYEDMDGRLHNVSKALSRRVIKCTKCNKRGATIGCCHIGCKSSFHFKCLIESDGLLLENKLTYCDKHKLSNKTNVPELHSFQVNRFVVTDDESDIKIKDDKNGPDKEAKIRIGGLIVESIGDDEIVPLLHDEDHLFPDKYKALRRYPSCLTFGQRETYILEILYKEITNESGIITKVPTFHISIEKNNEAILIVSSLSSHHAFMLLRNKIASLNHPHLLIKERIKWDTYGCVSSQFFGFGLKEVIDRIEELPNVLKTICYKPDDVNLYNFIYSFYSHLPSDVSLRSTMKEMEESKLQMEIKSITGSARTDGYRLMTKFDRSKAFLFINPNGMKITKSEAKAPKSVYNDDLNVGMSMRNINPNINFLNLESSNVDYLSLGAKYKAMKRLPLEESVIVRRSPIHGWGLFALHDIEAGEMVIEYVGEAIRQKIADIRETEYNKSGTTNVMGGGCYLFRISQNVIDDATRRGSIARFINHSCQPNSSSAIINVDGQGHIIIYAKTKIIKYSEITYDYKFPIEDEALSCYCGAVNCIGRMN